MSPLRLLDQSTNVVTPNLKFEDGGDEFFYLFALEVL